MPTTTTHEISPLHLTMSESAIAPGREMLGSVMRRARKTNWDDAIARADRIIAITGGAAVIVAVLYFMPVFVNILTK